MIGRTRTVWVMIIACGVNSSPNSPNGPDLDNSR